MTNAQCSSVLLTLCPQKCHIVSLSYRPQGMTVASWVPKAYGKHFLRLLHSCTLDGKWYAWAAGMWNSIDAYFKICQIWQSLSHSLKMRLLPSRCPCNLQSHCFRQLEARMPNELLHSMHSMASRIRWQEKRMSLSWRNRPFYLIHATLLWRS
jgi:hypothetical protein